MKHILPLYTFFADLQKQADFSLGIDEYKVLIEVLEKDTKGKYFQRNPEEKELWESALYKLCKLLWFKPNQNERHFQKLFKCSFGYLEEELKEEESAFEKTKTPTENQTPQEEENGNQQIKKTPKNDTEQKDTSLENTKTEDKSTQLSGKPIYLNFQEGEGKGEPNQQEIKRDFEFIKNYVPLSNRAIAQNWRFLQQKVQKSQNQKQININKTVKVFAQTGYLSKPIFYKQTQNAASIITFIDHKGSMIAFKHLSLHIAHSAKEMAGIGNQIYFFRNIPQRYLAGEEKDEFYVYQNQGETRTISLRKLLKQNPHAPILIISDVGAVRGNYDSNRIEATELFLRELYQHTLKIAWLNPMPEDRWDSSSAYIIRELVDMFEVNPEGLQKAITLLKGKIKPTSEILFS